MQFEVEAILFDVDGTLVDSTAAVERTWRTWAAAYGLDAEAILAAKEHAGALVAAIPTGLVVRV
ncbi:HAD family hydrolase [Propioniciclava sinopodophylli]|jgi:beta-phosphoglucomutase-like phosphatase (HAD superfamily)|uniref:HAD family hydrolase n=1 Tax=Propioniciclava sinopodophylli TaxID=1837344 RepID=UPI0019D57136